MTHGGPGIPRRFHFKNMPLKDPAIQCFGEWSDENRGFHGGFRNWLKENGYGDSALRIYGAATRMAIGYLRKPYWTINPETDMERVKKYLLQSERSINTQADYLKGLKKLAEYICLRCHHPKMEKQIPWVRTDSTYLTFNRQLNPDKS
jgi:hypothetical protein